MPVNHSIRFISTDEVLKSRRNLIAFSFLTIAIILISPHILELKIAGLEIKINENSRVPFLLAALIAYEFITYCTRFYNNYFGERLEKIDSKTKELVTSMRSLTENEWLKVKHTSTSVDFEAYKLEMMNRLQDLANDYERDMKRIRWQYIFSELMMPVSVSSCAISLCTQKIINL